MEVLLDEILQDLKLQLDISSEQEVALLSSKIKNAIREVKRARNYPKYYTDSQIDVLQFFIRNFSYLHND